MLPGPNWEMDVCGGEGFFDCQRKREDYQQVVKCIHTSGELELPVAPRTSSPERGG